MDNNTLEHWGIKGMKWGRRRFQNKDGTLTPEGKKRYADDSDDTDKEAAKTAERRERALKSSNAEEVYANRDVLTTAEIRERLDRISVERQLAAVAAATKTTGMDRAKAMVDKANDLYKMANTPAAVAARKALLGAVKGKPVPKKLKDIYDNMDDVVSSLSDADLKKYSDRANSEKNFKQTLRELYKKDPTRRSLRELYEDRDNVSDKDLKDAFSRATTEKNIKKILDDMEKSSPKKDDDDDDHIVDLGTPPKSQTKAEYSTDGINWKKAYVHEGQEFTTHSTWDVPTGSKEANQLAMDGWDFVQKVFYDSPDDYLKQGDPDMTNTELCHYGVKGMKWGVRRTPEQLHGRVEKLRKTNARLADRVQSLDQDNTRYMSKSAAVQAKNNRAAKRMKKAERKMYKYEAKATEARNNWTKRYTRNKQAEEYEAKAAKYASDYKHYSAKIKCNKWAVKSAKAQAAAAEARDAIKRNEQMIDMYSKTLSAIDEGTIKRGHLFMQYIAE